MNYAFMTFSCPELNLAEVLALARRLGYQGVEPRLAQDHGHGIEPDADGAFRHEAREKAAEAGIALCCLATSCRYADPATAEEALDDTRRCIDLAGDVGAPRIRVFGGMLGDGVDREQAIDLVARSLASVADQAQDRGVVVCLETHDAWCDPRHVTAVMQRVDHPAVAVNWDIMHPVRAGGSTMDDAFETLRPWIEHVHFHDGVTTADRLQMVPIGTGEIDHRRAVQLLQAMPYTNYLSGEWINWEPWETHLPRELAVMRGYEG